jgi:hypothetical protein
MKHAMQNQDDIQQLGATIEYIPPPISAETSAQVWLSLRGSGILSRDEAALYHLSTKRLLMDSSYAGILYSEQSDGQP